MVKNRTLIYRLLTVFLFSTVLFSCRLPEKTPTREIVYLKDGWKFLNKDIATPNFKDIDLSSRETVSVPHDWAILGEFNEDIDAQVVTVLEDGEEKPAKRTGRTGALPHIGIGWYHKTLDIPENWEHKRVFIEFDGAMSHARVYVNGDYVGEWPYGYSSFGFDITDKINIGEENELAVRLENKPYSSRWYPGAGLYRNVRLLATNPIHIPQWGTYITTPALVSGKGEVKIATTIVNTYSEDSDITLLTEIYDQGENLVARAESAFQIKDTIVQEQNITVPNPQLWSPGSSVLYKAVSKVLKNGRLIDLYETVFGFRYFEFTNDAGFFLNGENMKLKGVCLHHDLGPIGAAINVSAIRRQLTILKEMGCNAIRTSHNPPAPELLDLADEMGFLVIDEAFDEWEAEKVENGYHLLWEEWAEKDITAMIHRDRNHPSIIMWSLGNEVREQIEPDGATNCRFLHDICHREDPTRPTTAGFSRWKESIENGMADVVDVPGWNYKPQYYNTTHKNHPEWKMYGSETASTVSSRGEYFFPDEPCVHCVHEPYHCSSYDLEYPIWATSPDREFAAQDSFAFMGGEFVWTGFDYLGEPTPYNEQWPARSSYFGIVDLCGIPKDRYYLYQSQWGDKEVLHLLPHWNWEGKDYIPVHCYTNYQRAELFVNGKSMGIKEKDPSELYRTYRLVWDNVPYEPGELKVVALDENNAQIKEAVTKTAGKPSRIILEAYSGTISLSNNELDFVSVSVCDSEGNLCPRASNNISFKTKGNGHVKAVGSGDPTSLEPFVKPERKVFNGKCMVYIQPAQEGDIVLTAESEGLVPANISISVKK